MLTVLLKICWMLCEILARTSAVVVDLIRFLSGWGSLRMQLALD